MPGRLLVEDFARDHQPGSVVGTVAREVDREGLIAVDHGALRLPPPARPGWGNQVVAFGPFPRVPGLACSVLVRAGHLASECDEPWPCLLGYLAQMWRGTQVDSPMRRLWSWRRLPSRDPLRRRMAAWAGHRGAQRRGPLPSESLAIGWFAEPVPLGPVGRGHGLAVRSAAGTNADLVGAAPAGGPVLVAGVQDILLHVVVVARARGALIYAASLSGCGGLPEIGALRPLLIDPFGEVSDLYVAIHQAVSGQVGFGADTRVDELRVAQVAAWADAWTSAHAADAKPATTDAAERGGGWHRNETDGEATLQLGAPTGLLHVEVAARADAGLLFRADGLRSNWYVVTGPHDTELRRIVEGKINGRWSSPVVGGVSDGLGAVTNLQVLDNGEEIRVVLNGGLVIGPVLDTTLADAAGVGVHRQPGTDPGLALHNFEAHPRELACPAELAVSPPAVPCGQRVELAVAFQESRSDVAGLGSPLGPWQHTIGADVLAMERGGVNLALDRATPAPRHRRLTDIYPRTRRIEIRRVGFVSNWEFGQDTGSLLCSFTAASGRDAEPAKPFSPVR